MDPAEVTLEPGILHQVEHLGTQLGGDLLYCTFKKGALDQEAFSFGEEVRFWHAEYLVSRLTVWLQRLYGNEGVVGDTFFFGGALYL